MSWKRRQSARIVWRWRRRSQLQRKNRNTISRCCGVLRTNSICSRRQFTLCTAHQKAAAGAWQATEASSLRANQQSSIEDGNTTGQPRSTAGACVCKYVCTYLSGLWRPRLCSWWVSPTWASAAATARLCGSTPPPPQAARVPVRVKRTMAHMRCQVRNVPASGEGFASSCPDREDATCGRCYACHDISHFASLS